MSTENYTVVIKVGGGEGIDPTMLSKEIAELTEAGTRVVLVHGGSHDTNVLAEALGYPAQTIKSPSGHESRRTDRKTLEIFMMAYCGSVNKTIVEDLRRHGVDSVGLSGIDAGIWVGQRKGAIRAIEDGRTVLIRDDLSGRVESVNGDFIEYLLSTGKVPVLTPPAVTPDGIAINVDADRAAAATAVAIGADELLLLSNVSGLYLDHHDPESLIEQVDADSLDEARSAAKGRMKNKVLAAEEALTGGVSRVVIGSAGVDRPIEYARVQNGGTVFSHGVTA
ncbi:MAG: [LysW]-aminoadipate kinase [Phycisphaerales bacterium]|nr:[LysW]-aminoadipate kinase [Phycisphaerales bacterium]